jgi:predicted dehydrogenase
MSHTRRSFLKQSSALAAGALLMPSLSFGRIIGANERLRFAVAGVNGRGVALLSAIAATPNTEIAYLCDVDSQVLAKRLAQVEKEYGQKPKGIEDYRLLVEKADVDVIVIATPEHWHAPMAIMALQHGKHVYVEKPCAHNPAEAEMLVAAQAKYGLQVQMGNQQRSAQTSIQAMEDIRGGILGEVYAGKAWYSNHRGSIGQGKVVPAPAHLNWDLWQGPAPRTAYRDNVVHYNWHWFKRWGTGEIHNNGTHEIDVCRWALGVDFPEKVTAAGHRLFHQDDWEFADTQFIHFSYPNGKMITWEGKSCSPQAYFERGRGATIHGDKGWILLDRNIYQVYDNDNQLVKEMKEETQSATTNTVGGGGLDDNHMNNLANGIRQGDTLYAPIADAYKSTMLCHLGQLALDHGGVLHTDPSNGHITDNKAAKKAWGRTYEKGWEPTI